MRVKVVGLAVLPVWVARKPESGGGAAVWVDVEVEVDVAGGDLSGRRGVVAFHVDAER